jgi:hypothetical protein
MDSEDADPDPGGFLHPTLFYSLWPRLTAGEETEAVEDADLGLARTD